jgi:hypothetical protein
MRLEKRKPSGREKDEASIKLLSQLREKLYSEHSGTARRAAFNLSWMQDDGLDILKEAMFSRTTRNTKSAAAYGLRKMRGRMQKAALELLSNGAKNPDRNIAIVCENALMVLKGISPPKTYSEQKRTAGRFEIRHIPAKRRVGDTRQRINRPRNNHYE